MNYWLIYQAAYVNQIIHRLILFINIHAAKLRIKNETAKHFGGLFTKIRVATALPSPPSVNDEYLILMKGNVAVTFFLQ